MNKLYKDKEWLKKQYLINKLSSDQIAQICNVDGITILRWLRKFNIKIRTDSESSKLVFDQGRGKPFKKNNENNQWRGNKASSNSKHRYIKKRLKKPKKCPKCGKTNCRIELSFNHFKEKHTRDPNDYIWLCHECHMNRDLRNRKNGKFTEGKVMEVLF